MTSLHATLRAASPRTGDHRLTPDEAEAAVVAWLAEDEATIHAAQALYEADAGRIRRPWRHLTPSERAKWQALARAALGALTP